MLTCPFFQVHFDNSQHCFLPNYSNTLLLRQKLQNSHCSRTRKAVSQLYLLLQRKTMKLLWYISICSLKEANLTWGHCWKLPDSVLQLDTMCHIHTWVLWPIDLTLVPGRNFKRLKTLFLASDYSSAQWRSSIINPFPGSSQSYNCQTKTGIQIPSVMYPVP